MLIGLCGAAGSGKNSVADFLANASAGSFRQVAFADPLYQCLSVITGLSVAALQDRDTKETVIPWLGKSPRQMLQTLGTDWGRRSISDEMWVRITMERIKDDLSAGRSVVITDVRFANEAAAVKSAGGRVIQVKRPGWAGNLTNEARLHASEAGLPDYLIDAVIVNRGSLNDLRDAVIAAII